MSTPQYFIDRNHAGLIIGIASRSDRRDDLDMICTFQAHDNRTPDNAYMILKALNQHDALVAALRAAKSELEKILPRLANRNYQFMGDTNPRPVDPLIAQIDAALAGE